MRKSGSLDFYYNFRLVEETDPTLRKSTTELPHSQGSSYRDDATAGNFSNVYADFGQLYFTDSLHLYKCSMRWQESIGITSSEKICLENNLDKEKSMRQFWSNILKSRVSGSAKLF